jgi:hypothetical protein
MGCLLSRPSVHNTIHEINDVIGVLHANIQAAEKKQTEMRTKARGYARKDRSQALFFLRHAKLYDRQIIALQGRVLTCNEKIMTLRNMHLASMQLHAIRSATRVFKDFTRQHDLDRVERLQDELEDGMQHVLEVSNVLENSMGDFDFDESELEAELNELELVDIPVAPMTSLPDTPSTQVCLRSSPTPQILQPQTTLQRINTR